MREEDHTPVTRKSAIFWVVMLIALEFYWRFGGMSVNFCQFIQLHIPKDITLNSNVHSPPIQASEWVSQLFLKLEISFSIHLVILSFKVKRISTPQLMKLIKEYIFALPMARFVMDT